MVKGEAQRQTVFGITPICVTIISLCRVVPELGMSCYMDLVMTPWQWHRAIIVMVIVLFLTVYTGQLVIRESVATSSMYDLHTLYIQSI